MIESVIEWLLDHHFYLVLLCVLTVMGLSALIDWINRQLAVRFQIRLPHRILAAISVVLVILSYVIVFAPTAMIMKLRGRRMLPNPSRESTTTYWTEREKVEPSLDYLRRQG